jgi:hypothetical protein
VSSKIIAIDTEVVIILAGGKSALENGAARARQTIDEHYEQGDSVWIPAPAFAECCHLSGDLFKKLRVAPFNVKAAVLTNKIGRSGTERSRHTTRQALKIDTMILATAESIGASVLYVGQDSWFSRAAKAADLKLEVRDLPPLRPEQRNLEF